MKVSLYRRQECVIEFEVRPGSCRNRRPLKRKNPTFSDCIVLNQRSDSCRRSPSSLCFLPLSLLNRASVAKILGNTCKHTCMQATVLLKSPNKRMISRPFPVMRAYEPVHEPIYMLDEKYFSKYT